MMPKLTLAAFVSGVILATAFITRGTARANTVFDLDISPSGTNGPVTFDFGDLPPPGSNGYIDGYIVIDFSNPGGSALTWNHPPDNGNSGTCSGSLASGSSCTMVAGFIYPTAPGVYDETNDDVVTFTFTEADGTQVSDPISLDDSLVVTPLPPTLMQFLAGLGGLGLLGWRRKRKVQAVAA